MRIVTACLLIALVSSCGGAGREATPDQAVADVTLPQGPDPCALVAGQEMEALIGPLAEAPYRVNSDREPQVDGAGCYYRARDRRNVTIEVDWTGGEMQFQMLAGTGQAITDILVGYDPATDTLEGAWDRVGAPFGYLIALKDSTSVTIDPLGSRLGLGDAARIASLALRRVGQPLDYSGAKATLARDGPPVPARNPCELVTRTEVEALMGPLREDPRASEDGSECEFVTTQEFLGSPVTRSLEVVWQDGFHRFGEERFALAGATQVMAAQMDPDLPTLGTGAAGEAEPWDERITLVGGLITVVKADVMLQIAGDGVGGFDETKALELLRIAIRRL